MSDANKRFLRYCEHRGIEGKTQHQKFLMEMMGSAWESAEHGWYMRVLASTHNQCICGGKPPDDKTACPACKIYHELGLEVKP